MLASLVLPIALLLGSLQEPNALPARSTATKQQPEVILLWPDGAPDALGTEAKDKPRVHVYRATSSAKTPTPAVVICPGGGYGHLAMGHEGHQIAAWFNSIGITGVILEYRHRGKGYGTQMLQRLAQLAVERGCGRFEWSVLDWNEPAIQFYKAMGADVMPDWRICRVTGDSLLSLAQRS